MHQGEPPEPGESSYGLIPYHPTPKSAPAYNETAIASLVWGLFNAVGMLAVLLSFIGGRNPAPSPGSVFFRGILILGGIVACFIAFVMGLKGLFRRGRGQFLAALGILLNLLVILATVLLCLLWQSLPRLS